MQALLDHFRIVLVGTTHPGNIGAAARAMKVMGLSELYLVAPRQFPCAEATALAAGADDLLARAVVVDDFVEALHDCALVLGTTARDRSLPQPVHDPRSAAALAATEASVGRRVALVFGREKSGLDNFEVAHCNALINIPTSAGYSSLNLAQAVQLVAYELRLAALEGGPGLQLPADWEPADPQRLEVYFQRLEEALLAIRFLVPGQSRRLMQRLRRLYLRARLDDNELNILNGIVSATRNLAREPTEPEQD